MDCLPLSQELAPMTLLLSPTNMEREGIKE